MSNRKDLGITQKQRGRCSTRLGSIWQWRIIILYPMRSKLMKHSWVGKNKNRHKDKKVEKCQGRSFKDKVPVFGILERVVN